VPTEPGALLILAIVLVCGVAFGWVASRLRLPAVTGQILAGVLLGPSVFAVFEGHATEALQPITHFALGLIAVAVGNHLNIRLLRNATKRLAILLFFETLLTPAIVFGSLLLLPGSTWSFSLLLAALAISTAPATIVAIVSETRSKGVFVKTLVAAVALNNIACICFFELAHTAVRASLIPDGDQTLWPVVIAPFRELLFSLLLGGGAGLALIAATWRMVRPDRLATASVIAILVTSGLADYLGISSLLSCLFLGVTLANVTPKKEEVGHKVFADFETAILAIFFTLAGMELSFEHAALGGLLAVVLIIGRFVGKLGSAWLAMRLAGATERVRKNLGLALIPQAGVAVGLIILVQEDSAFASIRDLFLAVGLSTVTINEIIGPIFTRIALGRSGDLGKDRPRLIDFLHEENIVTDFKAGTKEDAIAQLVDLLIKSRKLDVDREHLLQTVLERENMVSTCIGEGMAIPHGVIEHGEGIVGVMGLSRDGLRFETPDGRPVHCMVLLATPEDSRARHLEVIAALTRAIGTDRNIQLQLFSASSPAHAYEILHAEESEDFNYFLEDT
jgi:Kef-type K+ transport system membrane component KefB/mannitol/fructose-specific phosphotransferase system IIA component (Ntr-type)